MIKVCLSHDIDRTHKSHQYVTKTISSLLKGDMVGVVNQIKSFFQVDNYWTFKDFIEIEKKNGAKSTVFFLDESIKFNFLKPNTYKLAMGRYDINSTRVVNIIRWLDKNGWEIGLHGSYNSFRDIQLLEKEKRKLENIVGHEVIGIRQHYLNLNNNTWNIQNLLGFKYDSSYGYTEKIGFKNEKYLPFNPLDNNFLVIPLVLMDTCFMKTENNWDELEKILDVCEKKGSVLVVNFHQHVFNKYDFPKYKEAYIEIIRRCKKRECEFITLGSLVK